MLFKRQGHAVPLSGDFTEGVIWKQLLSYFFPILLGTLFQQLYNTADAIIVGKFVGTKALAAIGSTTTLTTLTLGFFIGLSSGAAVILSQYYGARNMLQANRTVHTAMALTIWGGLAMTAFGILSARPLLRVMKTPEDVLDTAVLYTRIYFTGMIPSMIYNVGSGLLRAVGDSRRPLYFLIISCAVNILLDIFLVPGLELGVAGAAWATVLSQVFSALLVLAVLIQSPPPLHLSLRNMRPDGFLLRQVIHIGLPAGLQSVLHSVSNMIIQAAINSYGTRTLAAYTVYGKIDALYWAVIAAFGVSITTFTGQNFGAGRLDRVRRGVRSCILMASLSSVIIGLLLFTLGKPLFFLFTDEAPVAEEGMRMLRFLVPFFITYVGLEILSGTLRGAGESLKPMIITLVGVCGVRILWVLLIAPLRADSFLFMLACYPITWTITSLIFALYYHSGSWYANKLPAGASPAEATERNERLA